jgi:hypothetical protein
MNFSCFPDLIESEYLPAGTLSGIFFRVDCQIGIFHETATRKIDQAGGLH